MHAPGARAIDRRLSVAPMLDWTDRHCRYFLRLITRHTLLYTEMITTGALIHGDRDRHLVFDPAEHPVALQLGGADPEAMARCARIGAEHGYDEININCGCPSDRVRNGRFGACLMAEPRVVADCVAAMKAAVDIPVTVKSRIGIDEQDSYEALVDFVGTVAEAGCDALIVHARKAWLQGLSPKENREIPPLRYDLVERLEGDFPDLSISINGGILTLDAALGFLARLDGVMIGREAYQNPWILADADRLMFDDPQQEDGVTTRRRGQVLYFASLTQSPRQKTGSGLVWKTGSGLVFCIAYAKSMRQPMQQPDPCAPVELGGKRKSDGQGQKTRRRGQV